MKRDPGELTKHVAAIIAARWIRKNSGSKNEANTGKGVLRAAKSSNNEQSNQTSPEEK